MRSVFYSHLVNGPTGDPALYLRIAHKGEALLFDCGELHALSTRALLKVRVLFVSHAHIDHLVGFDHLLRTFLYQDRTLMVCGPPGLARQVGSRLAGYTWNLVEGFPFELIVREWSEGRQHETRFRAANRFLPEEGASSHSGDAMFATPDWMVRACPLAHGDICSFAYALQESLHVAIHKDALAARGYRSGPWLTRFKELVRRETAPDRLLSVPLETGGQAEVELGHLVETIAHCAPGMKVAYVTDASPVAENRAKILALAKDADLLVIEAVFRHADLERARQRHHLTARLAGELGRAAGAAKLLVFHHSPRYTESGWLREEAERAFAGF